jgi:uncharacterized protein YebE (UPF0316 family)
VDVWTHLTPLLIFVAEVCVCTICTIRIIFVARGYKYLAPVFGFFEIILWLFAIQQVMANMNNWRCSLAFALGFTLGNLLGIVFEKKLAMGTVIVRVITHRNVFALVEQLRAANFGVTCVEGQGGTGRVQIVMSVIKRRQLPEVIALIETQHPNAFYAVDDVQTACDGIFPMPRERPGIFPFPLGKLMRSMMPKEQPELTAHRYGCTDGAAE